ncbi:MAG TPA: anti-sigma factor, partial [Burkholderiaceae bacterium]|nr:anti-sigma factor [Burkholderiaceae bacterium]
MKAFDEQQLHAYVDNALSEDERRVVEAYLADHPEDAARVRAWVQQNNALHRAFDPVLDEPHTLRVGARSAPPRRWLPWRLSGALAAGLAGGVALGFALGFFARDFWPEQ